MMSVPFGNILNFNHVSDVGAINGGGSRGAGLETIGISYAGRILLSPFQAVNTATGAKH